MKILWLSNIELSESTIRGTGSWLVAMSNGLMTSGHIELMNISSGKVSEITRRDCGFIKQWIVPQSHWIRYKGLPPEIIIAAILKVVDDFSPDLVHIWGVEGYWGLLTARKFIKNKVLLEIQGLKFACGKVFNGNLSFYEQLSCIGMKELVKCTNIFRQKRQFTKWGKYEKEIIAGHYYISTQSYWTQAQVLAISPRSRLFLTIRALREEFCSGVKWQFTGNPVVFCTAGYSAPFKGLHIAIRALYILKQRFPNIQLRIAGAHQTRGISKDGYIAWICREIRRMGLDDNVNWLGALSGKQVADELLKCSVMVLPTFVESYCLALAEAMMLGVPTVVSYTGGTAFLAKDEDSALFIVPGDEASCAYQVARLLTDKSLAVKLSYAAVEVAANRNAPEGVVSRQLEIYREIISSPSL